MAIEYTWTFPALDVTYDEEGLTNVVNTVHWIYTARDGDYTATMYSTVGLPGPGQPFTAYEDLTADIVQGWVENTLGADQVAEMQKSLANSIEAQKTPQGGSMTPPWEK